MIPEVLLSQFSGASTKYALVVVLLLAGLGFKYSGSGTVVELRRTTLGTEEYEGVVVDGSGSNAVVVADVDDRGDRNESALVMNKIAVGGGASGSGSDIDDSTPTPQPQRKKKENRKKESKNEEDGAGRSPKDDGSGAVKENNATSNTEVESSDDSSVDPNKIRSKVFDSSSQPSCRGRRLADCLPTDNCIAGEDQVCFEAPEPITALRLGLLDELIPRKNKGAERRREKKLRRESYHQRVASGGSSKTELVCSWQPPKDKLPVEKDAKPGTRRDTVNKFKHYTGKFFQNWWDWDAPIKKVEEDDDFQMKGYHREEDNFYQLENFCIRPAGYMAGWRPSMATYRGLNDATFDWWPGPDWGSGGTHAAVTKHVQRLQQKPSWYIDRKIVILPYFARLGLPMSHWRSMYSSLPAVPLVESVWPNSGGGSSDKDGEDNQSSNTTSANLREARDDVTVAYMMTNDGRSLTFDGSSMKEYTTLIAKSHFTFSIPRENLQSAMRKRFETVDRAGLAAQTAGNENSTGRSTYEWIDSGRTRAVCFKEGVVFQNTAWETWLSKKPRPEPHWSLMGHRLPASHRMVVERFRSCMNAEHLARKTANAKNPLILVQQRRQSRGLGLIPQLIKFMLDKLKKEKISYRGLLALETNQWTQVELVWIYSQIDIIFSTWSSTFLWSYLNPPRAVGFNINLDGGEHVHPFCRLMEGGLNYNRGYDYGGQYWAGGMHFNGLKLPATTFRCSSCPRTEQAFHVLFPRSLFSDMMTQAKCLMTLDPTEDGVAERDECGEFNDEVVRRKGQTLVSASFTAYARAGGHGTGRTRVVYRAPAAPARGNNRNYQPPRRAVPRASSSGRQNLNRGNGYDEENHYNGGVIADAPNSPDTQGALEQQPQQNDGQDTTSQYTTNARGRRVRVVHRGVRPLPYRPNVPRENTDTQNFNQAFNQRRDRRVSIPRMPSANADDDGGSPDAAEFDAPPPPPARSSSVIVRRKSSFGAANSRSGIGSVGRVAHSRSDLQDQPEEADALSPPDQVDSSSAKQRFSPRRKTQKSFPSVDQQQQDEAAEDVSQHFTSRKKLKSRKREETKEQDDPGQ